MGRKVLIIESIIVREVVINVMRVRALIYGKGGAYQLKEGWLPTEGVLINERIVVILVSGR